MSPGVPQPSRGRPWLSPGFWARDLPDDVGAEGHAKPSGLRLGIADLHSNDRRFHRRDDRSRKLESSFRSSAISLSADSRSSDENPVDSVRPRRWTTSAPYTQSTPSPSEACSIKELARLNYQRKITAQSRASFHGETNIFAAARLSRSNSAKTSRRRTSSAGAVGLHSLTAVDAPRRRRLERKAWQRELLVSHSR
eukprot:CAMPEP_0118852368 /NCGR_PEP_ID=MMETSP1163-20130328/1408_1 /TAXON_ID=124430 /ORGANISM="Phaeomonas parva, Strain CCMP2877" /LENGTH=195 /DNA_ID=CAMNT_0006784791 /DNA_START=174 /DNA_END=761 /DNA_ORIENTATION=+